MRALIDADIILHEFGNCTDDEYKPLRWPLVQARVQSRIDFILQETEATSYQLYLTSRDKSNFRYGAATIKPYKGTRPFEKPFHYDRIRDFLIKHRGAEDVFDIEADDEMSIVQCVSTEEETVICTKDKDLDMVPGWHFRWHQPERGVWYQDEMAGLRCFYKQCLTGDSVDNIPGLHGVGQKSSHVKRLDDCDDELSMYALVREQYEKRFGAYWRLFLEENAKLLWMLRTRDDEESCHRIERLEKEYQESLRVYFVLA